LTSRFWPAFSASKLSERVRRALGTDTLRAEHDAELPRFGIGFTDVVKRPSANAADLNADDFKKWVPCLLEKLQRYLSLPKSPFSLKSLHLPYRDQ